MSRKIYRYSLKSPRTRKLPASARPWAMCINIDPTILRIGLVAVAVLVISWSGAGRLCRDRHLPRRPEKKASGCGERPSEFERMAGNGKATQASVAAMRARTLDVNDRRLMAIDHHLAPPEDHELAREIEALREDK